MFEAPPLSKLQEAIASPSQPIGMRMRAAYFLRQAYENAIRNKDEGQGNDSDPNKRTDGNADEPKEKPIDDIVIETLSHGLLNPDHGSLLRHEFAYVMGQLRDKRCCPSIEQVLLDTSDCIMVRHECGEALGAIGSQSSIPILEQAIEASPNTPEIGQTCRLAIDYMEWKWKKDEGGRNENGDSSGGGDGGGGDGDGGAIDDDHDQSMPMVCACMLSPYSSVDPAPPHPQHVNLSTEEIGKILTDISLPLFERYRAMFSLRNRGGSECVLELCRGLLEDDSSALFRHEVAYVLGQMQHPDSVEALAESLRREGEHAMVRHESAEALGAIEGRWDDVETVLKTFLDDKDDVIRESAVVALDAADYWGHSHQEGKDVEEKSTCSDIDDPIYTVSEIEETTKKKQKPQSFVQVKAQLIE